MKFRKILLLSSGRTIAMETLVLFCIFTGVLRGLLEALFFDARTLAPPLILSYVPFYSMMFLGILLVLRHAAALSEARVMRAPLAALFLGLFPPLLDLLISGRPAEPIRYGYFLELFMPHVMPPGLFVFYMPDMRLPPGETIVVWATITLTAIYARLQGASWLRAMAAFLGAYLLFFFHSYIIPSVLRWWLSVTPPNVHKFDLNLVIPLTQLFLTLVIYAILRGFSPLYALKRLLHIAPFLLAFALGSLYAPLHPMLYWSFIVLLFLVFYTMIIQNDVFDASEDAAQGRPVRFDRQDIFFFTAMMAFALVFLLSAGIVWALFVLLILACGILYSFPFYRGKGKIFATMKFEGIWGAMSFLAGAIPFEPAAERVSAEVLVRALLVFLGWSLFALLKDVKDIRADYRAGQNSVYIWFLRRGKRLRSAHAALMAVTIAALCLPIAYFLSTQRFYLAAATSCLVFVFIGCGFFLPLRSRFQGLLATQIAYLACILAGEYILL